MYDVVSIASWNVDLSTHAPRPARRGETLQGQGFVMRPGGKGSNAAVAAARQGARTAVVARIGQDSFGHMGMALWQREGIQTQAVVQVAAESSGTAQILVYPDGDNSIVISPGANAGLDAAHVRAAADILAQCKVVLATFEVPLPAISQAFSLARAAGAITVLNAAPARAFPAALKGLVDWLTPNETELLALAGDKPNSPHTAAQFLWQQGVQAVLVTQGKNGATLYRRDHALYTVPGHTVPVRDTVGAGDTFNGALAAALARGDSVENAIAWANAAAALSVGADGAIDGIPDCAAVATFLHAY